MDFDRTIPILRIFDVEKAREFYIDYLGMQVDFEHRFEPELPLYMQVSRGNFVLHLSEHHGDGTPGSAVLVRMSAVPELHASRPARSAPSCSSPTPLATSCASTSASRVLKKPTPT
jgi:catechol 2,3-dioxygenase-like lactoylglutathione lyase family enzyme